MTDSGDEPVHSLVVKRVFEMKELLASRADQHHHPSLNGSFASVEKRTVPRASSQMPSSSSLSIRPHWHADCYSASALIKERR
jgi:hypothetical protein